MEKSKDIWVNRAQCSECEDFIQSHYVHDYKTCSCGKSSVDGGLTYIRFGGSVRMQALFEGDDYGEIRKYHCRGGRGINSDQPVTWTPLSEMSDNWLKATIEYNNDRGLEESRFTNIYKKELQYRNDNNIFITE